MPDITMCSNKTCRLSNSCYRTKCKPNPWMQSYSEFPADTDKAPCEYHIPYVVAPQYTSGADLGTHPWAKWDNRSGKSKRQRRKKRKAK